MCLWSSGGYCGDGRGGSSYEGGGDGGVLNEWEGDKETFRSLKSIIGEFVFRTSRGSKKLDELERKIFPEGEGERNEKLAYL